ncbi:MAG TPA: DUF4199 domain-containing protein [Bacteroidales bacterium]|nr:DUF4199 domain-containing protein [Bacteroidales bacterium]
MEAKVNPWKANLTNGLIMGLVGVVFTLILWFLDLTFNKSASYIFLVIAIVLLYYFIKSYRDNYLHGMITYGQSLGAGMIIFIYQAVIAAIFGYLLYTVIDPELTNKSLAFVEEQMRASGKVPDNMIDTTLEMQKKFMKPGIMAIFSILSNIFFGLVLSLIVSIFTRKEGNPLIDAPAK